MSISRNDRFPEDYSGAGGGLVHGLALAYTSLDQRLPRADVRHVPQQLRLQVQHNGGSSLETTMQLRDDNMDALRIDADDQAAHIGDLKHEITNPPEAPTCCALTVVIIKSFLCESCSCP